MATKFLTAEWRKLIMAQYEVAAQTLARWLPSGVDLDLYQGRAYVSLVGFLFDRVRIKGVAVPFHTRFEEVNLRFYVRRPAADGSFHRGVVFIREYVPKLAISLIANILYEEPYATLPTRRSIDAGATELRVRYDWRHQGSWQSLAVEASPDAVPIAPGSEEEFITEHYWGYTKRRDGSTSAYQVEHPRWTVYPVRSFKAIADFGAMYGGAFRLLEASRPASVLLAEGSAVSVFDGVKLS